MSGRTLCATEGWHVVTGHSLVRARCCCSRGGSIYSPILHATYLWEPSEISTSQHTVKGFGFCCGLGPHSATAGSVMAAGGSRQGARARGQPSQCPVVAASISMLLPPHSALLLGVHSTGSALWHGDSPAGHPWWSPGQPLLCFLASFAPQRSTGLSPPKGPSTHSPSSCNDARQCFPPVPSYKSCRFTCQEAS